MKKEQILAKAIEKWGLSAQMFMAIEEMSELTKALSKVYRDGMNPETVGAVYEELADVELMLEQLHMIFQPNDEVERIKEKKLKYLEARLNDKTKK